MAGGLVGLLDDVAALAKLAAASVDDVGEAAAKASRLPVVVHSYPEADHGFNLRIPAFRAQDASDAWARVQEVFLKHHPL